PLIAKSIRRLTERLLFRPFSAPLYSLCTALGEPPKSLRASPTGSANFAEMAKLKRLMTWTILVSQLPLNLLKKLWGPLSSSRMIHRALRPRQMERLLR
ncbi:hypothetical protein H5410_050414, partial [Solanum commersonii]